jgi:hypothetical protein
MIVFRRFEPATSAVWRQREGLLELSGVCKTAAKTRILFVLLCPVFQKNYPDCCTVAARLPRYVS